MFTRSKRTRAAIVATVAAVSLIAASCGGDDDDDGGSSEAASGTESASASSEASSAEATSAEATSAEESSAASSSDMSSDEMSSGEESSGGSAGGEATDLDPDAELIFAHSFGASSLDPHTAASTAGWSAWMRPVYDRLLTLDPTGEVAPQLATSYEFSDDGLELSMELRDDVTFWDGTPFNGQVVADNIDRAKNVEGSTVASQLAQVDSVEVVDDTHVVFQLNTPYPGLAYSFAADTIGMMVNPNAFDTDLSTQPAGSGPYQLVSFQPDGDVVYERWGEHWDPDAAPLSKLTITTVSDSNARYNGVRSGEFDMGFMSPPTDLESQSLQDEGFYWVQSLAPLTQGILMNTSMAPFDDVNVRKAVYMAIDRDAIANELLEGLTNPTYQVFATGYLGNDPDLDTNPYDPEAAKALIDEAGVSGTQVTLLANAVPPFDSIAQVAQQQLGEIGLEVEIEPVNPREGIPTWLEGGHGFYVGSILAEPDPSITLAKSYLSTYPIGDPDPELVTMADEALTLPMGSAEREEAYQAISAYLLENPVHAPLVQFSSVVLANPDVVGAEAVAPVVIGKLDLRNVGKTAG